MSREGSRTALVVQNATEQRDASAPSELSGALAPSAGTLRLRGGPRSGPRVAWDEAVVDNEGLGRKKSKSTYWRSKNAKMLNGTIDWRLFQFVVSITDQGGSTSHQMKTRPRRIRARMTTLRGRLERVCVIDIDITIMQRKGRVTVESWRISE